MMQNLERQINELVNRVYDKEQLLQKALEVRDNHALSCGETYYNGILNKPEDSHQPFSLQTFLSYHPIQWLEDLKVYYDISDYDISLVGSDRYPMKVHLYESLEHKDNLHRHELYWRSRQHLFMFSIATFHMFVECQTIGKLYGYNAMVQFHRATWLPLFINDAGGTFHPIYCIGDSLLYPLSKDVDEYLQIFDAIRPYLEKDSAIYFRSDASSVNAEAHRFLLERVNVEDFLAVIREEFDRYRNWVKDPSTPYPERHFPAIYDN